MEYRLKQGESVPEGVRRMAAAQLDKALAHLGCEDGERDKHIHEARKATKRLRALVRLVRRDLGDEVYALENQCYRDVPASGFRGCATPRSWLRPWTAWWNPWAKTCRRAGSPG